MNIDARQRELLDLMEKVETDQWDTPPTIYLQNDDTTTAIVVVAGDLQNRENVMSAITSAVGNILGDYEDTVAVTIAVEALTWFIDADSPLSPDEQKAAGPPVEIKLVMTCTAEELTFALMRRDQLEEGWITSTEDQARGTVGEFLRRVAQMVQPLLKEAKQR